MAKTKRRNNKVRNRRTKSRRGGGNFTIRGKTYGPNDPVSFQDRFHLPFNRTSANAGFVFNKNYRPSTFSLIPPLSSLFSSGVRKRKKNMYEQFVYRRQKELEKIENKANLTPEDENKIKKLKEQIEHYKFENQKMLRDSATRSNYKTIEQAKGMVYDAKRKLGLGDDARYSSDSSDASEYNWPRHNYDSDSD